MILAFGVSQSRDGRLHSYLPMVATRHYPLGTPLSFGLGEASVWGILSCGDESILGNLEFEPVGGLGWQNNLV